jgi:uncharacterized protein (TIRG00374 family)
MKVSLVIPAHNEEDNIIPLINELVPSLEKHPETCDYEIILVNDNSADRTPEIIDELVLHNPRIRAVHRAGQPGFGNAIKAGLTDSTGDIIIPVMGDLSDDPEDIPKLVKKIDEGYDVAYGSRFIEGGSLYNYPPQKMLANRAFNNLTRLLFGIPHRDVTNAFKAYRREVIESIGVEHLESSGFDLTLEIPIKAYIDGYRSIEVPVHWYNREAGEAKLKLSRNASVYGKRLLKLFFIGNVVSFKDLFKSVLKGSWIGVLLGLFLGIIILAGLFAFFGFSDSINLIRQINPVWLLCSCLAILLSFVIRTWRWSVILRSSGFTQPADILFKCIMFSWLLNYILPLRIGDIARAIALKTTRNAPFGMTLSTIIVERVYDLLALAILLVISGCLIATQHDFTVLVILAILLAVLLTGALMLVYRYDRLIVRIFGKRIPSLQGSITTLKAGLANMADDKPAIVLCFILSFPVWLLEIGSVYFAALAVRQPIQYIYATLSGIAAFIAQSLPLTPAGIGIHEASITAILMIFNIPAQIGLSIALTDHAARALVIFVFGIPATIHIGFASRGYFRKLKEKNLNNIQVES